MKTRDKFVHWLMNYPFGNFVIGRVTVFRCYLARILPWYRIADFSAITPDELYSVLKWYYDRQTRNGKHLYIHAYEDSEGIIKLLAICPEDRMAFFCG